MYQITNAYLEGQITNGLEEVSADFFSKETGSKNSQCWAISSLPAMI